MSGLSPVELSELTRLGYLQCPIDIIRFAPADEFARHRELWRGTFAGACEILNAQVRKLTDEVLETLGFRRGVMLCR